MGGAPQSNMTAPHLPGSLLATRLPGQLCVTAGQGPHALPLSDLDFGDAVQPPCRRSDGPVAA